MLRSLFVGVALAAALSTGVPPTTASPVADAAMVAGVPAVIAPPGPGSVALGCPAADTRIELTASSHLDPSCVWTRGFDITASNVVLDCQGATIAGTSGRGIEVVAPIDVDLTGVVIRNCRVEGFLNGFRATRDGFRTLPEGAEYDHELADVVLEHNEFSNSAGVGLYVDGYVSRVTIRANRIERTGSTGVYLETGSRQNRVEHNVIHDNGYRENGPGGQVDVIADLRFRWWGIGREGVAIDGSYENVVMGNDFAGNSHGGVMLYTNCGEFPDSVPERSFDRRWPADRNLIEGNTFTDELNGVWVGQRMGENTFPMECAKPPYVTGPLRSITLDFAADNIVRNNDFADVVYGVRVEDDGTVVEGNTFVASQPGHHGVIIGTPDRTAELHRPVARTTLTDNAAALPGNTHPYRWVHGYDGLTVLGNTAHGSTVGICEGTPPPRLPLIWVLAAVLEPVGAPVTPTPSDLAHPLLGPLETCPTVDPPIIVPGFDEATEGTDDSFRIPVRLSHPSDQTVTARWDTPSISLPGIARVGQDFVPTEGVLHFDPGQTEAFVTVAVYDDQRREPTEIAVVSLRDPVNARMGGFWGLGFGVIHDDDRRGRPGPLG